MFALPSSLFSHFCHARLWESPKRAAYRWGLPGVRLTLADTVPQWFTSPCSHSLRPLSHWFWAWPCELLQPQDKKCGISRYWFMGTLSLLLPCGTLGPPCGEALSRTTSCSPNLFFLFLLHPTAPPHASTSRLPTAYTLFLSLLALSLISPFLPSPYIIIYHKWNNLQKKEDLPRRGQGVPEGEKQLM